MLSNAAFKLSVISFHRRDDTRVETSMFFDRWTLVQECTVVFAGIQGSCGYRQDL